MAPIARPKGPKRSKVVKPKKSTRSTTGSHKNHRFQPFSERIANLKIDPIRRRRNAENQEELRGETDTYMGNALEGWRDLNMSQTFTSFVREAAPLCESLPALLYNEGKMMELLVAYIDRGDALAMEPLLSLLSSFAHDLDARFEKHFQLAVSTVAALAAKHSDPAVVEWSFTCLAWLFKYLSRLLVPDLRPLYDLMAPYLGTEAQKPFIIRFAAESVSFLVRKAAAAYDRNPTPLNSIVAHMLNDCESAPDLQRQGVMALLTEAIHGVQGGLHSAGSAILHSMLDFISERPTTDGRAPEILVGVLTSTIHHTNVETFRPVQKLVLARVSASTLSTERKAHLLFTIASVQRGTRISDWTGLVSALRTLVEIGRKDAEMETATRSSLLSAVAIALQSATMNAVLPNSSVFETLRNGEWAPFFLRFCDIFARLGHDRFQQFLLPQLQKYIVEHYCDSEDAILSLLPDLATLGVQVCVPCPEQLQQRVVQHITKTLDPVRVDQLQNAIIADALRALRALPHLKLGAEAQQDLVVGLESLVRQSLNKLQDQNSTAQNFALGASFAALLQLLEDHEQVADLWPVLCSRSADFMHLPGFWTNLLRYIKACRPSSSAGSDLETLELALLHCLSMPSHEIRQAALDIIAMLYKLREREVSPYLSTAITIESLPITFETSRRMSMEIRRLAQGYDDFDLDPFVQRAIPSYCFGLLHVHLTQAWDDAVAVLAELSKNAVVEEVITDTVQKWLDGAGPDVESDGGASQPLVLDAESNGFNVASDFECSNLARLSAISKQVFNEGYGGRRSPEQRFLHDHKYVPFVSATARAQALRVLNKIPHLAEKRSRMLVPILLRWAGTTSGEQAEEASTPQRWNRADQKAMLSCFAQFTNPKVLYKQAETYSALLNLCSNGDIEIQRPALKAICAWKEPAVVKYEHKLLNLLDENQFRDELSAFLQESPDNEDAAAEPKDYPKLMPVLLRLIYGRAVAGGKQGQGSRRKAVFVALSRHGENVLESFVDIALGPLASLESIAPVRLEEQISIMTQVPLRKQLGMVNMFDDMLETLGSDLGSSSTQILNAALLATISASRIVNRGEEIEDASLLRSIRQSGMQCLVQIFAGATQSDLFAYAEIAMQEIVAPRLEKLPSENTQSVSGLLRLVAAWSTSTHLATCVIEQPLLLEKLAHLLREPTAKDQVRIYVLQDILDKILDDPDRQLESDQVRKFTASIGHVLDQQSSKPILETCVRSLTKLAQRIDTRPEAESVLGVCATLLSKPGMIVSAGTKVDLLRAMIPLLDAFDIDGLSALYNVVCGLWSRLQAPEDRALIAEVLGKLSTTNAKLIRSASICADLNAVGTGLQEVDHERRERGFASINELASNFSVAQWLPIVHNCFFFVRDAEDMVNRSSASQALLSFISAAARDEHCKALLADILLPDIERGMKNGSELVRNEYLQLLGCVVASFPEWPAVSDMTPLSVGGDDEASVFANILHIQQHRRLRALRRLAEEANNLSSSNTTKFFVPLLEHFVFNQVEGDAGRTLSDQTIQTLGALAKSLNWPAYRATIKRYIGYLSSKEDHEKAVLRLLGTFVDALAVTVSPEQPDAKKSEIVVRDFLPPLTDYVHHKDESTIDRRMPVAVTIVKMLQTLPEAETTGRLAPVLSDVCHVLRSRSQEARDQTRKTLAIISSLVGPGYLGFILKELRSALQRGYQLHVLSFTVHSLLLNTVQVCEPGDLDYCIPSVVEIIMDDIFGVTGQEKDAEEYKSGMKEVKSSKSFDTMELLAKTTPVEKLGLLVKPLRDLLSEKLDSKMLKKIDDLLTRLRKGLDQNPAADRREMLVFCHEIVRQVHAEQQPSADSTEKPAEPKHNRYLIHMDSANKSKAKGTTTSQLFKLASFALNLVRKVLRRHEDLLTAANMAGFLPIAGDALVQGQEDVQTAAVKLLSTIMKLPLKDLDTNAPVYVHESVQLVKRSTSMTSDSAKAALELITAVLRDKRSVSVKERDIAEVLKCIKADIDEPDRQGVIYKFLRAVLGRKVMIKEVYELMDEVGKVVVTNPDRNVRESARSAYFSFVMEYPQGKDRWSKQAAFFVENLKYEWPSGRQSVMELLNQLLKKIGDDVFVELAFTLFVALVPVLANDEDRACRQMAKILISELIERANEEQYELYMKLVEKWLANDDNQAIMIAALKCWEVLLDVKAPEKRRIEGLRDRLRDLLAAATDETEHGSEDTRLMAALQTVEVLMHTRPDVAFASCRDGHEVCKLLATFVAVDDLEVKELAPKLLGVFFSHIASSGARSGEGLSKLPLRGAHGIAVNRGDLRQMCYKTLSALQGSTDQRTEAAIDHNVRNLVFLGRCFAANGMQWKQDAEHNDEGDDGDDNDETGEEQAAEASSADRDPSALAYLLNRLTYIARQETFSPAIRRAAVAAPLALLPHLSSVPNLSAFIHPLYLLTDPSIPQPPGEAHRALVDSARELLEAVQKKVGSEAYLAALGQARKAVGMKREERRQKRRVEAVSQPEKWAREKRRRVEGKKARKREVAMEHRGRRRGW